MKLSELVLDQLVELQDATTGLAHPGRTREELRESGVGQWSRCPSIEDMLDDPEIIEAEAHRLFDDDRVVVLRFGGEWGV